MKQTSSVLCTTPPLETSEIIRLAYIICPTGSARPGFWPWHSGLCTFGAATRASWLRAFLAALARLLAARSWVRKSSFSSSSFSSSSSLKMATTLFTHITGRINYDGST